MGEEVLGAELGQRSQPRGLEPFLQRPTATFQQEAGLRTSFHHQVVRRSCPTMRQPTLAEMGLLALPVQPRPTLVMDL